MESGVLQNRSPNSFKMIDLKKVNVFVLYEADVMIDTQGHQDQSIVFLHSKTHGHWTDAAKTIAASPAGLEHRY